ncbi:hypothetical protein DPMN_072124 [Dreissena polymorpha]|uniref:Serine-threonine/tyrosine-protein kinase catalytic domain-containing protein n=1 Tax=Dreissena polymorpha TaxID=45954 RepID=A0A9D3Z910_DREPO|nr:hypothetical protein DPMN_072124 [Dreissena polymorpha]
MDIMLHNGMPPADKADVYAFSLILDRGETPSIPAKKGTIALLYLEIIELLRSESPSIRPDIARLACEPYISDCIRDCWAEDPDMRPTFKDIRVKLKPMLQGM